MEHRLTSISMRISSCALLLDYTALFHSHSRPLANFDPDLIYLLHLAQEEMD